jgi:hypothetical protein
MITKTFHGPDRGCVRRTSRSVFEVDRCPFEAQHGGNALRLPFQAQSRFELCRSVLVQGPNA